MLGKTIGPAYQVIGLHNSGGKRGITNRANRDTRWFRCLKNITFFGCFPPGGHACGRSFSYGSEPFTSQGLDGK